MRLLTIGQFGRESGLSAKALRLYDRLGLLTPAAVDSDSGYRFYDPGQLRRARLIAELRAIDMPLAEVRRVCGLPRALAARAVDAYWRRVSADSAARGRQAAHLVERLSGKDQAASVTVRHALRCEIGGVRAKNQDCAYADAGLLAVADGGGPAGETASTRAVETLRAPDLTGSPPAELLGRLATTVNTLNHRVRGDAAPFSTLTALVRSGTRLALAHIGDSRAYLLRDGELAQLTRDHTWVQGRVDAGRLTPDEAAVHPQRALLVRALGMGGADVEADLALRTALPGDRYLLCTDGLHAVVPRAAIHDALAAGQPPAATVERLVGLVRAAGAPDNVACVVAEVVQR